ncbi:hypothetical protein RGU70_17415 [Herbaspirillum sp. RTI4]|uniref:hypothetical protein n=1 Tax=Herbaspirillum sp. RTI4 TaxID=3048640 RepID=UPI002AB40B4D|nr:hypothetical protein [Herbaspirillum sp. RTI4]MDY7580091.1 hypothetical protein [Herbaspirillum sp. RTI4]MEA9983128.1 hypothetical protein [Herbaspirillum sp. RTI4]
MFEFGTRAPMHDPYGLYRSVLQDQAVQLCELLTKRLIRKCQSEKPGLMEGQGINNLWEEICVSMRMDSWLEEAYLDHLEGHLTALVDALPLGNKQMLWLMTYDGVTYATSPEWSVGYTSQENVIDMEEPPDKPWPSIKPKDWPINSRRIAREIIQDNVLYECFNYDNHRIRACTGD